MPIVLVTLQRLAVSLLRHVVELGLHLLSLPPRDGRKFLLDDISVAGFQRRRHGHDTTTAFAPNRAREF